MLSLCFHHVATVASPFRSTVFHFLARLSQLSLLHKNVNTFSHTKDNLMGLTAVVSSSYDSRFEICPANNHYPGRDHETWFGVSKFSSYPRSS